MIIRPLCLFLSSVIISITAFGSDTAQWRGADRKGDYTEKGLLENWPNGGPQKLWQTSGIGNGYSSAIAVDTLLYISGQTQTGEGVRETVSCLNKNGKILWQTPYGKPWTGQYPPTRSTPTYRNGALFISSGTGEVAKLDANSGKLLWNVNAKAIYGGTNGNWGTAESLAVDNKAVYFTTGGNQTTMVALSVTDGSLIWKSKSLKDTATYVSPTIIEHNGTKQIVGATTHFLFGIAPQNGNMKWDVNLTQVLDSGRRITRYDIIANSLVYTNGMLLLSNGYDHGSLLLQLNDTADKVKIIWKNLDLTSKHHGFSIIDNVIYSTSHNSMRFTCVDFKTGKTLFNERIPRTGLAQIISASGLLYLYTNDRGRIILARPNPKTGYEEISSFQINFGNGEHWSHPIISDGIMYIRRGNVIAAFDIKAK